MFGKIRYWFENYWYYYKWPVIIIAAFAAIFLFCFTHTGDTEDYDVTILYTGPTMLSSDEKATITANLTQVRSKDEEGKSGKVGLIDMPAYTDEQIREAIGTDDDAATLARYAPYTVDEVKMHFSQRVFAGDAVICLLDVYWYELLLEAGGLVPLEEILGYRPDVLRDEYSVLLSDLNLYTYLNSLPEDTVLCFRRLSTAAGFTGKDAAERNYERAKGMLKDIFAFGVAA